MTFYAQLKEKYEALLLANVGVKSISVDGQTVSYENLLAQYEEISRKVEKENGERPVFIRCDLSRAWND